MSSLELSPATHDRVVTLCQEGDAFARAAEYQIALERYFAAWDLLPEPKTTWEAATWILAAVGDANFLAADYTAGRDNLRSAMHCPGAIGNPFIHLRLGQCEFQLGNAPRAADELLRAYAVAGSAIFEGADEYFDFLKRSVEAPSTGWK